MSDSQPPAELLEAAVKGMVRSERICWAVAAGFLLVGAVGVVLVVATVPTRLSWLVAVIGLWLGALYVVAGTRKHVAATSIRTGPFRSVRVEGWCRPPDGCNYGIFDGESAGDGTRPDWVMRLPLRREMFKGSAWLCGSLDASAAALVGRDGEILGAGRLLSAETGSRVWYRRETPPSRFVTRPPEDFHPPGG